MKRSKHIHLVLVTAALASCNRIIIPADPSAPYVPDSTLTTTPAYTDSTYNCDCEVNNYDQYYSPYWHYGYYYNSYYPGWGHGSIFYTGRSYRSRTIARSSHFVARGGFGKLGVSAAT
jgi:hypothetical protein